MHAVLAASHCACHVTSCDFPAMMDWVLELSAKETLSPQGGFSQGILPSNWKGNQDRRKKGIFRSSPTKFNVLYVDQKHFCSLYSCPTGLWTAYMFTQLLMTALC